MVRRRSAALARQTEPYWPLSLKPLVVDLAEQTPSAGQSINKSSRGRREPVLFVRVCVCVSDPRDSRMVFAVQPDPSGLNKLDTLGARAGMLVQVSSL